MKIKKQRAIIRTELADKLLEKIDETRREKHLNEIHRFLENSNYRRKERSSGTMHSHAGLQLRRFLIQALTIAQTATKLLFFFFMEKIYNS